MDRDRRPDAALPSPDLHRHLGELLQKGTGADVTFHVSGEEFAAHKAILASRSPVFMAELFGGMEEEASRRVEVKDMEPAAFKALLRFIYTDTALDLDQKGEDATSMAQHLLAGADRYSLDRLKLICEGSLADRITVDTAATTLALAEQHGCLQLKASCVEFIAGYLDAVLETEGYKHLEASCPSVLTDILKATRRPIN
jgi:speckle-type POZ protein